MMVMAVAKQVLRTGRSDNDDDGDIIYRYRTLYSLSLAHWLTGWLAG